MVLMVIEVHIVSPGRVDVLSNDVPRRFSNSSSFSTATLQRI